MPWGIVHILFQFLILSLQLSILFRQQAHLFLEFLEFFSQLLAYFCRLALFSYVLNLMLARFLWVSALLLADLAIDFRVVPTTHAKLFAESHDMMLCHIVTLFIQLCHDLLIVQTLQDEGTNVCFESFNLIRVEFQPDAFSWNIPFYDSTVEGPLSTVDTFLFFEKFEKAFHFDAGFIFGYYLVAVLVHTFPRPASWHCDN